MMTMFGGLPAAWAQRFNARVNERRVKLRNFPDGFAFITKRLPSFRVNRRGKKFAKSPGFMAARSVMVMRLCFVSSCKDDGHAKSFAGRQLRLALAERVAYAAASEPWVKAAN